LKIDRHSPEVDIEIARSVGEMGRSVEFGVDIQRGVWKDIGGWEPGSRS
jgi:hypothetical protein